MWTGSVGRQWCCQASLVDSVLPGYVDRHEGRERLQRAGSSHSQLYMTPVTQRSLEVLLHDINRPKGLYIFHGQCCLLSLSILFLLSFSTFFALSLPDLRTEHLSLLCAVAYSGACHQGFSPSAPVSFLIR